MKRFAWRSRLLFNVIQRGRTHVVVLLMVALTLTMSATVACNSGSKQSPAAVTPTVNTVPDGAKLLDGRCSSCHGADKPKQARKTLDQWDKTVSRMIDKGARLTESEKAVLLEYLGKTYGL